MAFADVLGQSRPAAILGRFLKKGRIPSAMVFHGPDGVGKTMMALEFAKALLCPGLDPSGCCGTCPACVSAAKRGHPDLKLVDTHYQGSLREEDPAKQKTLRVDTLRHLRKDMEFGSMMGSWKVAVIAAAHTMDIAGASALLKIMEEPPPKTLWILVTSRLESLPATVRSRAFLVSFNPLSAAVIRGILIERGVEERRAADLSELCDGSASRALELHEAGLPAAVADPFDASEGLPRELYLARVKVELSLFCLEQSLRLKLRRGEVRYTRAAPALQGLGALRRHLHSNADPGTILAMAHLEVENQ
jgi:DNA polymerase-3 subunit delta'